jgi:acyl dehydratase
LSVGPITQTDIVRFAGAGGDFNPLHHDPETAEAAGFERPIAMGQLTAALVAAWVTDQVGVENLRSFEVRFSAPLRIDDRLLLSATAADSDDDTRVFDLRASRDDVTVLSGRAVVAR